MIKKLDIRTGKRTEFQDLTGKIRDIVTDSGVENGICYVFVPHTTAGVTINEHADPSVIEDMLGYLEEAVPQNRPYRHLEGNSPAHIKASLMGSSAAVYIEDGRIILGTWQGVYFCEFDGPRNRSALIKIVPGE